MWRRRCWSIACSHRTARTPSPCVVFDDELGATIVPTPSAASRSTTAPSKILTAVNVPGELARIAMRGARYGFPRWVTVGEAKRRYIEQRSDAQAKAIECLQGAKTA
jgi:hypothetical protein